MKQTTIIGRVLYLVLLFFYFAATILAAYFLAKINYNAVFNAFYFGLCGFTFYTLAYFKTQIKNYLS